jgi:DNA-binding NtrC family response regulator
MGDDDAAPGVFPPARTTVMEHGREHYLVRRVGLRVLAGPDAGLTASSVGDRTVIGKHASCDVVLRDPAVSRLHCEIAVEGERAVIRDLGSRNGTLLDGTAIAVGYARDGSVLSLGQTQIALDLGGAEVRVVMSGGDRYGLMVGRSPLMRGVFALLDRAAGSDATVLLEGETGTGKEVAAESLHAAGARKDGPFIVVDCGAIPPALLESELFGHERGAFTGAVQARKGAFEAASGGTLFLDEIGELGLELQPKLLRALERREVKRVGADRYLPVDVRIVAATHRSLAAEVNAHRFRADLFYRLAVVRVLLPPLRERLDDLPLLLETILGGLDGAQRPEAAPLRAPAFLEELGRHRWPGNVRELRNYVERCLALGQHMPLAEADDAPANDDDFAVDIDKPLAEARNELILRFERRYLAELLERHGNNVSAVARAAGLERSHVYRLLWRSGLR